MVKSGKAQLQKGFSNATDEEATSLCLITTFYAGVEASES
jgi:hypothetical protein